MQELGRREQGSRAETRTFLMDGDYALRGLSDVKPDMHVVSGLKTVVGDSAFTSWLGYPKSRNCWRSIESHFPCIQTTKDHLLGNAITRITVERLEDEPMRTILIGRCPPRNGIRKLHTSKSGSSGSRRTPAQEQASKKARKRVYETKVHTIRIDRTGIREVRGIKRAGVTLSSEDACAIVQPHHANDVEDDGSHEKHEASIGTASRGVGNNGSHVMHEVSIEMASRDVEDDASRAKHEASIGMASPEAINTQRLRDSCLDERSGLWEAHRQLNEGARQLPETSLFRIEVVDIANSQVNELQSEH